MTIPNQGYRKDLNLEETDSEQDALDNLGGAGISNDISIIRNNLRNISTVSYSGISTGFFYFGSSSSFVFTNDDVVSVSSTISLPSVGAATTSIQSYNTISGVDPNLLSVDVYALNGIRPVVIYIHGGGFALGDKSAVHSKATFFNNLGYVFVSVNYRLSPSLNLLLPYGLFVGDDNTVGTASTRVKHTNHVTDCANAIAWVYNNINAYGGDRDKLVLMGHSAGAVLASLLVTNQSYLIASGVPPSKILGCISNDTESYNVLQQVLNPIQDGDTVDQQKMAMNAFGIYPDKTVTGTATTITTDFATKAAAEAVYATGSAILNISESTPPFLVLRRGAPERIAQETEFVTALQNAGRTVTAVSYPGDTTYTHAEINESIGATNDPPVGKTLPAGVSNVSTVIQNWITNLAPVSSVLDPSTSYYVCNSNAENRFKLSTTPSSIGINTIFISSVSPTSFNFIRNDAVHQSNLINFIRPETQDTAEFSYLGGASINNAFDSSQSNNDVAKYLINTKYKTNQDVTSTVNEFKYEGIVTVNDPVSLNVDQAGLDNVKSPGVFIANTRAFSSDNNPWNQVGTALSTSSNEVSVGELFFSNDIYITGINTESATSTAVTTFSHKLPVVINGDTYYLLLKTS